jgi:hypothetical protein
MRIGSGLVSVREEIVIEVKRADGQLLVGGQAHSYDEARELVERIWAAIPIERTADGRPICPKCGIEAIQDIPGFWVGAVIECDGYHQAVSEDDEAQRSSS